MAMFPVGISASAEAFFSTPRFSPCFERHEDDDYFKPYFLIILYIAAKTISWERP